MSTPDDNPRPSSVTVNLESVDAMFATLMANVKHQREGFLEFKTEVKQHLEKQDGILTSIKTAGDKTLVQATNTNGRLLKNEKHVEDLIALRDHFKAKIAGFILAISVVGAIVGWFLSNIIIPYLMK